MPIGSSNCPSPVPDVPHLVMNVAPGTGVGVSVGVSVGVGVGAGVVVTLT